MKALLDGFRHLPSETMPNKVDEKKVMSIAEQIDEKELLRLCKDMIRISSVTKSEHRLSKFIHGWLERNGLVSESIPVEGYGPSVVGRIKDRGRPVIVLNGHMDTVEVKEGWKHDPFGAVVENGMLYGLGSLDMKCGLAGLMIALRTVADSGLELGSDVVFQAVTGEEDNSAGTRALIRAGKFKRARAVIVGEGIGSLDVITIGRRGGSYYDIHVKGKSVHGSTPRLGVNAISDGAKVVRAVDSMKMRSAPGILADNSRPIRESQLVLGISGGSSSYSVPEKCDIRMMRATIPGKSYNIKRELLETIGSLGLRSTVTIKLEEGPGELFLPHMTRASEPLVKIASKWVHTYTDRTPSLVCGLSEADDNIIAEFVKVPVICVGPGEKGELAKYHQAEEALSVQHIGKAARIYCGAVLELANAR